jgi:hypothetical protein
LKAIVHIGTEKTGTTSIQGFLYQNRKKLKSAGFHFIQSAGQTNNRILPAYCIEDDKHDDFYKEKGILTLEQRNEFKREFIRDFETEIQSAPKSIHTFIISSEHFHSRIRSAAEMDNVYRLLSTYFDEFKIICYLREQTTTCTSSYSTHMKTVGTESLDNFLLRCRPGNYYYNYHDLLANWERCFGFDALNVSIFAREHFLNGDLLDDFTAKIDPLLIGTLTRPARAENESLRPIGQALARAVNITFPANSSRAEAHALRERCKKVINDEFTGKGQQPTLGRQKRIYESFIESNELVRQKFFPLLDILFPPPEILKEGYSVTEDDFQGIASIFNVLKRHGKGVLLDQEYANLCSTIFSCINDVTQVASEEEDQLVSDEICEGDSGVDFNQDDATLLLCAAGSIRGRDPKAALKLVELADRMFPDSPGILEKLEEFRQRSEQAPKPQYLITYQTASPSLDQEVVNRLMADFKSWLHALEVPEGSPLVALTGHKTVRPDGSVTDATEFPRVGFTVFEAGSMDDALAMAKTCPFLELGGTLEISEFLEMPVS